MKKFSTLLSVVLVWGFVVLVIYIVSPDQEDDIVYADEGKKIRYVNIQIIGDLEDYKIKLGKAK